MGDIDVLNPLQTLVPACGQVRFCDPGDADDVRFRRFFYGHISVGTILLAVRYGKCRVHELDDLSHRRVSPLPSPPGLTPRLGAGCARVVGAGAPPHGGIDVARRLGKLGSTRRLD